MFSLETRPQDIHRDIIEQCRRGDRRAFKQMYDLYSKAMYSISVRILNDRDEASDVLQDAFTDAFRNLGTFRYESSFGAWLKKIVVFKSINVLKKKQRHAAYIENERYEIHHEAEEDNTAPYTVELIKSAMAKLPEGSRTIFSLYLLEGYDHTEIATIMNISESTSKSQYMRARNRVKELLKEQGYEKR